MSYILHLSSNEKCPYIRKPFTDCYCANLTSRNIESAIYYCNKYFNQCDIYINNVLKENTAINVGEHVGYITSIKQ